MDCAAASFPGQSTNLFKVGDADGHSLNNSPKHKETTTSGRSQSL